MTRSLLQSSLLQLSSGQGRSVTYTCSELVSTETGLRPTQLSAELEFVRTHVLNVVGTSCAARRCGAPRIWKDREPGIANPQNGIWSSLTILTKRKPSYRWYTTRRTLTVLLALVETTKLTLNAGLVDQDQRPWVFAGPAVVGPATSGWLRRSTLLLLGGHAIFLGAGSATEPCHGLYLSRGTRLSLAIKNERSFSVAKSRSDNFRPRTSVCLEEKTGRCLGYGPYILRAISFAKPKGKAQYDGATTNPPDILCQGQTPSQGKFAVSLQSVDGGPNTTATCIYLYSSRVLRIQGFTRPFLETSCLTGPHTTPFISS